MSRARSGFSETERASERSILDLIESLCAQRSRARLGIGDDCALYSDIDSSRFETALTTDSLVCSTHFKLDWSSPADVGVKLASVNLSDLAAMGAMPRYALLSLIYSDRIGYAWLARMLRSFHRAITRSGAALIGGNIARSRGPISLTATMVGAVESGRAITRSGAREGDLIYLSGECGLSAMGRLILTRFGSAAKSDRRWKSIIRRHLAPPNRLEWGRLLLESRAARSMIDISDGLALDLERLLKSSGGLGATIQLDRIQLRAEHRRAFELLGEKRGWEAILSGGEDYELLFTVAPENEGKIEDLIARSSLRAKRIGEVTTGRARRALSAVRIVGARGEEFSLRKGGWEH